MEVLEHEFNEVLTVFQLNNQRDPSRTTVLRQAFVNAMNRRFTAIARLIFQAIVDEDVFGLMDEVRVTILQTPGPRLFNFPRSGEKVSAFMNWLEGRAQQDILQVTQIQQVGTSVEGAWTNMFINDSYRRGVIRARSQMRQAGMDIPTISETGGVLASMNLPVHADRVGLLFTRTFNELKGITNVMEQQISRVLSQGLADGLNPRTIGRQLVATITGSGTGELGITDTLGRFIPAKRRAQILARTEIIRAHAEAQLQEFKNWGVEGVTVKAEWITAGDNRVCEQCAEAEGSKFTIEQAQGLIPLHAQCRCAWIPFIERT